MMNNRRLLAIVLFALLASGCVRGCPSSRPPIHINPNMDDQPRYEAQSESTFFYDGMTMRQPVAGTVARGQLRLDSVMFDGRDAEQAFVASIPIMVDEAVLARGSERFEIFCAPCHDARGSGQGILAERGGVPTANLHDERMVAMPAGELFDVISNGKGLMAGYRSQIPTSDRWAIVAHVVALQSEGAR